MIKAKAQFIWVSHLRTPSQGDEKLVIQLPLL